MPIKVTDIFSIDQLCDHLRVDDIDKQTELMIEYYGDAALGYCLWYCDEPKWQCAEDLPSQVKAGTLLVLADLFENRSSRDDVIKYSNQTADNLLWSCRNFASKSAEQQDAYDIVSYEASSNR